MQIDINCDLGEGKGQDENIMPYITSCNIACGGHFGDKDSISQAIILALKHHVKVGAHPSYPDQEHFGRRSMPMSQQHFQEAITNQLTLFFKEANNLKVNVHHIKAHGALYNDLSKNTRLCEWYLECLQMFKDQQFLYLPYLSELSRIALKRGFKIKYEAFADRAYNNDLTLVSRQQSGALLSNTEEVIPHIIGMIENGKVKSIQGIEVPIEADTFCVHGDQPKATVLVASIYKSLTERGYKIG